MKTANDIGEALLLLEEQKTEWPDPVPFNDYADLPDFPIEVLPSLGKEMVEVVSEVNQIDLGMTAAIYLSVLSTCASKKYVVDLITHKEKANIYTCSILPSGNRKSSTMECMTKPLYEWQKCKQDEMTTLVLDAIVKNKVREARRADLQKKAARKDDSTERQRLENEASSLAKEISDNPIPSLPIVIADDITSEKTGIVMAENNECLSIMSTEGGIFGIMAGRYNEKGSNFDLYLKAHSGDPWSSHRVGREAKTMQSPYLTICLTVQPDVIKEIGENRQFRGRGLLARFLYTLCKSEVGYRERQIKGIPHDLLSSYRGHIFNLMDASLSAPILRLSTEAQEVWDHFYNDIETEMRRGGSLQCLQDWGSKLPGAVARIAALLHYSTYEGKACDYPISVTSVTHSCVIGSYFKEHATATFGYMGEDHRIQSAKLVLEYLLRHKPETFSARDTMRGTHMENMDKVYTGLSVLAERGYIRGMESTDSGPGRPESKSYKINPKIKMSEKL